MGVPLSIFSYLYKKNISETTSVQIIDKTSGHYKVYKTIGSSSDNKTIKKYIKEA